MPGTLSTFRLANNTSSQANMNWQAVDNQGVAISQSGGALPSGESMDLAVSVDDRDLCCDVTLEVVLVPHEWQPPEDGGPGLRQPDPLTRGVINVLPAGVQGDAYQLSQGTSLLAVIGMVLTVVGLVAQVSKEEG